MPIVLGDTTITGLTAGGLPNGVINSAVLANGAVTSAKLGYSGSILQAVYNEYNSNGSFSNVDFSILDTSITPSSTTSKILIITSVAVSDTNPNGTYYIRKGSTAIPGGAVNALNHWKLDERQPDNEREIMRFYMQAIDSPNTTSAVSYNVAYWHETKNGGVHTINRPSRTDFNTIKFPASSTILLLEISG
jgi:hypothetical protein